MLFRFTPKNRKILRPYRFFVDWMCFISSRFLLLNQECFCFRKKKSNRPSSVQEKPETGSICKIEVVQSCQHYTNPDYMKYNLNIQTRFQVKTWFGNWRDTCTSQFCVQDVISFHWFILVHSTENFRCLQRSSCYANLLLYR